MSSGFTVGIAICYQVNPCGELRLRMLRSRPPSGFRDSAETNRACDGGIISKSYLWSETSAIRSATAQLRL